MKYELVTEAEFKQLEIIAAKWVNDHPWFKDTTHKYAAMEFWFNQNDKTMYLDFSTQNIGDIDV